MSVSRSEDAILAGCFLQMILVFLASLEIDLQYALNGFAAACDIAGMKISITKTEVLYLSRNSVQCSLQVQVSWVAFTSDGRQDEELDVRSGKTSAVIRALTIEST